MAAPQNSKPLSYKAIESMKPGDKDKVDIGDYRGLRVACGKTGKKSFYYRYNDPLNPRKQKQVTLGVFPAMSLEEARTKFKELKLMRHQGICPATELSAVKVKLEQEPEVVAPFTITDMIELYLTEHIEDRHAKEGGILPGARKPKGQAETRRTLYNDPVRVFGERLATEVPANDIVALIMEIVARGANVQAGSVLRELSAAFDYAIGTGKLDEHFVNPVTNAKKRLKLAKVRLTCQKGTRILSDEELKKFLLWLPSSGFTIPQKNVLRMTLWTGCRTGEICGAYWRDIDLSNGTFHLKETKTDTERYVQLPRQAIDFLHSLKLITGDCLFPSILTKKPIPQKLLTETAWRLRKDNVMIDIPSWTPHDLRRTVRTGLAKLKCPSDIAEAILGHAPKGIEGTYNLHRYNDECKEWLQKWADHLERLIAI